MTERWKSIIAGILVSSWFVYVYYTYRVWHSPQSASVQVQRVWLLLSVSAAETVFATLAILPRWQRYYAFRALVAAGVLLAVAVALRPLMGSPVDRVFLQWVAVVSILLLNVSLVSSFLWVVQRYMAAGRR